MRNIFPCLLIAFYILTTGCLKSQDGCPYKENNLAAPASEEQMVANYISANNINAIKHSSNMYYEILSPGTGGSPNVCSQVTITYSGKLTNGSEFDHGLNSVFVLGGLIEGMKKGLPLIQKGGRIKLYIPPSLGYGGSDIKDGNNVTIIPANSVLIFDVTLVAFE